MTKIQQIIKERGGCRAVAEWAGVAERTVQDWNNGKSAPIGEKVYVIAHESEVKLKMIAEMFPVNEIKGAANYE